jgi:hypothetical protein
LNDDDSQQPVRAGWSPERTGAMSWLGFKVTLPSALAPRPPQELE